MLDQTLLAVPTAFQLSHHPPHQAGVSVLSGSPPTLRPAENIHSPLSARKLTTRREEATTEHNLRLISLSLHSHLFGHLLPRRKGGSWGHTQCSDCSLLYRRCSILLSCASAQREGRNVFTKILLQLDEARR